MFLSDELQDFSLDTCLAAFFAAEEISYSCPECSKSQLSSELEASSTLGNILEGQMVPLTSQAGPGMLTPALESPAPSKRRVRFSGVSDVLPSVYLQMHVYMGKKFLGYQHLKYRAC